jgi:FKBP-type peptidyl-prolyl cis-trans isomerase 2
MQTAKLGDRVRVQYSRVRQHGARHLKSSGPKICEFTVGGKEVFPGLSLGIAGMAPGDRKQLTIQPQEAFGAVKLKLIRQIPRDRFPLHIALTVGKRLTAFVESAGRRRRVRVVELNSSTVTLDGNHPLAGQIIELEVNLISVDSSSNANKRKPPLDLGGRG